MPSYDYGCPDCGVFSLTRPMAEYDRPQDCVRCGKPSPRLLSLMPAIAGMDGARRAAIATNERSAHAPRSSHSAGCGCCRPKGLVSRGVKSFPAARPWMISH